MLCYVMLCYVMLCYVMLCYVMLCYAYIINLINHSPCFFNGSSSAHQGSIYLIKIQKKTVILKCLILVSSFIYFKIKCIPVMQRCIFSIITLVFSVT